MLIRASVLICPLLIEKKKRLRYTPISVRFGETEAASDFGSVCLAQPKSEVHTEVHPYYYYHPYTFSTGPSNFQKL
jgi:hypothetical protein